MSNPTTRDRFLERFTYLDRHSKRTINQDDPEVILSFIESELTLRERAVLENAYWVLKKNRQHKAAEVIYRLLPPTSEDNELLRKTE